MPVVSAQLLAMSPVKNRFPVFGILPIRTKALSAKLVRQASTLTYAVAGSNFRRRIRRLQQWGTSMRMQLGRELVQPFACLLVIGMTNFLGPSVTIYWPSKVLLHFKMQVQSNLNSS